MKLLFLWLNSTVDIDQQLKFFYSCQCLQTLTGCTFLFVNVDRLQFSIRSTVDYVNSRLCRRPILLHFSSRPILQDWWHSVKYPYTWKSFRIFLNSASKFLGVWERKDACYNWCCTHGRLSFRRNPVRTFVGQDRSKTNIPSGWLFHLWIGSRQSPNRCSFSVLSA